MVSTPPNIRSLPTAKLSALRAQHIQLQKEIESLRPDVTKPSSVKFIFLGITAAIGDIVDFASLTGVGLILTFIVDFFVGAILLAGGIHTHSRTKKLADAGRKMQEHLSHLERRITQAQRLYTRTLKAARKTRVLRRPTRRVGLAIARLRRTRAARIVLRSPVIKNSAAIIADLLPAIELFPFRTLVVLFDYNGMQSDYKNASSQLQALEEQLTIVAPEETALMRSLQENLAAETISELEQETAAAVAAKEYGRQEQLRHAA